MRCRNLPCKEVDPRPLLKAYGKKNVTTGKPTAVTAWLCRCIKACIFTTQMAIQETFGGYTDTRRNVNGSNSFFLPMGVDQDPQAANITCSCERQIVLRGNQLFDNLVVTSCECSYLRICIRLCEPVTHRLPNGDVTKTDSQLARHLR